MLERWTVSVDYHSVFKWRGTGWNRPRLTVDFNQTQATGADRLQAIVMTKGGNIDTNGLRRFQDGEGLLKLMGFTIYCRGNQNLIFLKTSKSPWNYAPTLECGGLAPLC